MSTSRNNNAASKNMELVQRIAGVLSLVQALIWLLLSVAATCTHYCLIYHNKDAPKNENIIWKAIYSIYLAGECDENSMDVSGVNTVLNTDVINKWILSSIILNFLWICSALPLLSGRGKSFALASWTFLTTVSIASDVGFGAIFAIDLARCYQAANILDLPQFLVQVISSLLMLILTTKGGGLLIINFALVLYFLCVLFESSDKNDSYQNNLQRPAMENPQHSVLTRETINAYSSSSASAPELPQSACLHSEVALRAEQRLSEESNSRRMTLPPGHDPRVLEANIGRTSFQEPYIPSPDYDMQIQNSIPRAAFPPKSVLKNSRYR